MGRDHEKDKANRAKGSKASSSSAAAFVAASGNAFGAVFHPLRFPAFPDLSFVQRGVALLVALLWHARLSATRSRVNFSAFDATSDESASLAPQDSDIEVARPAFLEAE